MALGVEKTPCCLFSPIPIENKTLLATIYPRPSAQGYGLLRHCKVPTSTTTSGHARSKCFWPPLSNSILDGSTEKCRLVSSDPPHPPMLRCELWPSRRPTPRRPTNARVVPSLGRSHLYASFYFARLAAREYCQHNDTDKPALRRPNSRRTKILGPLPGINVGAYS